MNFRPEDHIPQYFWVTDKLHQGLIEANAVGKYVVARPVAIDRGNMRPWEQQVYQILGTYDSKDSIPDEQMSVAGRKVLYIQEI